MINILFVICMIFISNSKADNVCGNWLAYGNEKCVKLFIDSVESHDTAVNICKNQSNRATLVSIRSRKEQEFLENYIFNQSNSVDSVWLGGTRNESFGSKFYWEDGTEFAYTNWDDSNVEHATNNCIEMQAEIGYNSQSKLGKWISVSCMKRNLVLCQYPQNWTIDRLQNALIDLKHQYETLNEQINEIRKNNSLVPIGFIYAQLPNQVEPKAIWPNTVWQDISNTYAGLFFRVFGGSSADFGTVQNENTPNLKDVRIQDTYGQPLGFGPDMSSTPSPTVTPSPSLNITTKIVSHCFYDSCSSRFHNFFFDISKGEVIPKNQAIRIWKRIL